MQTSVSRDRSFFNLQPTLAWTAILGFVLFTALCVLVGAGGILRLAYPAGAFLVGAFLHQRYVLLYVGFAWWVAFLSPFVRRLIDYQIGWADPNPVLLAPFLVVMVSALTFLRYLPKAYRQGGLPFVVSAIGIAYGFLIGLIRNSPTSACVQLLNWLPPLLLGFYLFANWQHYPALRQNMQRVFVWGVLITGLYGILQFLAPPEWDRYWLVSTGLVSFGLPEPLEIRVFSTMNSPGPFATVLLGGLLLLFTSKSPVRFIASGAGYLSFLLSLVRSAWLGWIISVLAFIPSLKPKFQMRLIMTILVMSICVLPLTSMEPFATAISSRLETFSNAEDDVSYNQRMEGYTAIFQAALAEIPGNGLGYVIKDDNLGSNDSGILTVLFNLGWFGALPYLGGIVLLMFALFQGPENRFDPFLVAARAVSVGVLAQLGLGTATLALSGFVFWGFAGIALAGQRYYRHQQTKALLS